VDALRAQVAELAKDMNDKVKTLEAALIKKEEVRGLSFKSVDKFKVPYREIYTLT
jgi:hypothetical protein